MKLAFYKGTRTGLAGLYNRLVRLIDGSIYSHAEVVFSDGMAASSSYMDGGVRFKTISFDPAKWDLVDAPAWFDEDRARAWFVAHDGAAYDLAGNLRFVLPFWPHSRSKWFCTEAIAASGGPAESRGHSAPEDWPCWQGCWVTPRRPHPPHE